VVRKKRNGPWRGGGRRRAWTSGPGRNKGRGEKALEKKTDDLSLLEEISQQPTTKGGNSHRGKKEGELPGPGPSKK